MAERPSTKPEIAAQKRVIKLPPSLGDWTTYRPPKILVKKVKTGLYGFDRLSMAELNQSLLAHYRFIQDFFSQLKIDLKAGVEFFSAQVEQTTYMNFLRTLNGPVVQGKLSIPDIHEGIQIFIDLNLANSIINHALGSHDLEPTSRGLTEAESAVLSTAINEYLPHYVAAFAGVIAAPSFSVVSSPEVTLDPSINTSSTFVAFSAEAALNENPPGKITFGYLGSTLKNIISRRMEKEKGRPLDFSKLSPAALARIMAPVTAILGKTSLFTTELHNLESGDVVSLDTPISSALVLAIGNFLKLMVQPGTMSKKKAVRIAGFKEEDLQITPPTAIDEEKEKEKAAGEIKHAPAEKPAEIIKEEEALPEEDLIEEEFPEDELLEDEEFPEEDFLSAEEDEKEA